MASAYKEMAKLDGVPVLQTIVMGGAGQPGAGQPGAAGSSEPAPAEQPAAERPSLGGALGGGLGGGLGRLGGLGRKKAEPKQEASAPAASGTPGSLLEMKTELSSFSAGPVDESQFVVPAGFKKVDPPKQ
jgi:hypothetical protein